MNKLKLARVKDLQLLRAEISGRINVYGTEANNKNDHDAKMICNHLNVALQEITAAIHNLKRADNNPYFNIGV